MTSPTANSAQIINVPNSTCRLVKPLASLLSLAIFTIAAPTLHAASATWTNADGANINWANDANWTTTYPGNPGNTDTLDLATFSGSQSTIGNPNLATDVRIGGIVFDSGGWTISGTSSLRLRGDTAATETKSTTGTNIISVNTRFQPDGGAFMDISSGSTLVFDGGLDLFRQIRPIGAGTLVLAGTQAAGTQMAVDMNTRAYTGTLLLNYDASVSFNGSNSDTRANYLVNNGATLGGTGSVTFTNADRFLRVASGGTLAPGGNGTWGAQVETFNVNTVDTSVIMQSGSILSIDLGASAGSNDVLTITSSGIGGFLDLNAGNVTLNLTGSLNQAVGTYTFATFDSVIGGSSIYGTFATINYNGVALDPMFGLVNYNTDNISFSVIPEPSTYLLPLGLGLGVMIFKLRRAKRADLAA
jgi:hypothetical protein